jgi:hypothetical protein
VTIEPVAGGIKFTTDIDFGSGAGGMSTTYVTKLDGAEVPVYSAGKVVMTLRTDGMMGSVVSHLVFDRVK